MTGQAPWTIKRLLDWTSDYFTEHGSDSPRLAAEVLLAEAMDCQRIQLYTRYDQEPDEETRARFRDSVRRHAAGEPVAYLVGHREFFSLGFSVDPRVLIPRPETEHLVTETLDIARMAGSDRLTIADVGTGSGAIAIALAKHLPTANITAIDISPDALTVARANAAQHQVADRIRFAESDLFTNVEPGSFDFVVSNPPYIGKDEMASVAACVRQHEPAVALFPPGGDAMEVIRRLVAESAGRLVPGGWLLFEMSPLISERCRELLDQDRRYTAQRTVRDLAKLDRMLVAQRLP